MVEEYDGGGGDDENNNNYYATTHARVADLTHVVPIAGRNNVTKTR